MKCPNCNQPLSPAQITKLWSQLSASKRLTKTGGRKGGRPPTCLCGACPKCIRRAKRK